MKFSPHIYFVAGVSGVGKTSTIKYLNQLLPAGQFNIRDFDERGVPDGGGRDWHTNETLWWLGVGVENSRQNKSTVICGFIHPERLRGLHQKETYPEVKIFILHASSENIRKRLEGRYTTEESIREIRRAANSSVEDFIINCVTFAPILKSLGEKYGDVIIETDNKAADEVAKEVAGLILSSS